MKKSRSLYFIIFILFGFQLNALYEINQLKAKLQLVDNNIAYLDYHLSSRINDVYSNVDTKLREQASLVTSAHFEVGEFNVETLKVPFTFRLQPKVLTNTTKVFLNFKDERVPMIKQGTEFFLTKEFDLNDENVPMIEIEDKGVSSFEENNDIALYDVRKQVFSSMYLNFSGFSQYTALEPYEFNAEGIISITSVNIQGNNDFIDIKYVVSIDDIVVKTLQTELTDVGSFEVKDDFKVKSGQRLIGKVVAIDRMNMSHEYIVFDYVGGEENDMVNVNQNEKIITPNGVIIYEAFGDDYY
jgi:hypothetical protein